MTFEYTYDYNLINKIKNMESGMLVAVSIDNFPYINSDENTQEVYEDHIIELQETLSEHLSTKVTRYSDHIFFILTDKDTSIDKDILKVIRNFNTKDDHTIFLKCILGYTIFVNDSKTNDNVISKSLAALQYATKKNIHFANYADYEEYFQLKNINSNHILPKKLIAAVNEKLFCIYIKPIVDSINKTTKMYECILHLNDKFYEKDISESQIMSIAEEFNFIDIITDTISALIKEKMSYNTESRLIIKISTKNCINRKWSNNFINKMKDLPLAKRIILELSPNYITHNEELLFKFINEVKNIGCKVMLSEMNLITNKMSDLYNLRLDYIKIDEYLIKNTESDPTIINMISFYTECAKSIGAETIACNVDKESTSAILEKLGINYLQGSIIGSAIPIDKI